MTVDETTYRARTSRLLRDLEALPAGAPIRLRKSTSNLFRSRRRDAQKLDARAFDGVLSIDPSARTADVLGMTTYEHLVDETLRYGLMPLVVPQLKTITIGGAVAGLGIESSSFRNGMPHESVLAMDVLTGDGRVVHATPDGRHDDLFAGFPNSYGSLGYALRLTVELEPVRRFVRLRHLRFDEPAAYFNAVTDVCTARAHDGDRVDFVDGVIFGHDSLVLTLGSFVDRAASVSDYTGMDIYYRSLERLDVDHLTVRDYLWRWDTDWFWCSRAFGVQNPRIRRFIPRRFLRSDVYWRLLALDRSLGISRRIDGARGVTSESVIQDVQIPVARAPEFLEFFAREIGISPIWVCPVRPRGRWPLYPLDPSTSYVNFGFWSAVRLREGERVGDRNRSIERVVEDLGGMKSLYSTAFYPEDDFRRIYNGDGYDVLKKTYDGGGRLADLYSKCVREGARA